MAIVPGATFGVGPVHKILTNGCYASGRWLYGVRRSRDGESTTAAIDARKIDAFARLMGDKLEERVGWAEPILQATPRILSQGLRHTCLMSRNGDGTSNFGSMLELIQPAT